MGVWGIVVLTSRTNIRHSVWPFNCKQPPAELRQPTGYTAIQLVTITRVTRLPLHRTPRAPLARRTSSPPTRLQIAPRDKYIAGRLATLSPRILSPFTAFISPPPTIAPFYPAHLRQLDFVNVLVCLASALITNTSPCPLYTALLRSASSGTPDRSRRPPAKPRIAPYSPEPPLLHWPPHPSVHCLIPRSPPDCH